MRLVHIDLLKVTDVPAAELLSMFEVQLVQMQNVAMVGYSPLASTPETHSARCDRQVLRGFVEILKSPATGNRRAIAAMLKNGKRFVTEILRTWLVMCDAGTLCGYP